MMNESTHDLTALAVRSKTQTVSKPPLLIPLLVGLSLLLAACTGSDTPSSDAAAAIPAPAAPADRPADPATSPGPAPDFTLPTLDGDSLRLSDLRGRVVVLNFWATWCAPCVEEIPELIALHDELSPHGLSVVGVSLDDAGSADLVRPFAERFGITYPVLLDDGAVAASYGGVWALPTTYVIDPDGQIMQRVIGLFPVDDMRPQFRDMLGVAPSAGGD